MVFAPVVSIWSAPTTVTDCGDSRIGTSIFVAAAVPVGTMPTTGPGPSSARPVTVRVSSTVSLPASAASVSCAPAAVVPAKTVNMAMAALRPAVALCISLFPDRRLRPPGSLRPGVAIWLADRALP